MITVFSRPVRDIREEGAMRFLKSFGMIIYMFLLLAAGSLFILVSLKVISCQQWEEAFNIIHSSLGYQITLWATGTFFIITGIIVPFRVAKNLRRNRHITFQNPDGEVTISIPAIEDYVRKVTREVADITNVRSRVCFNRKGLNIVSDVTVTAGINIPEITEKVLLEVKNRVHAMIGAEEKINMTMHISRIAGDMPAEEEQLPPQAPGQDQIPFRYH